MAVVVVTGASAGVGRATAIAFARRGFDVGLLARGEAGLKAATADVEANGVRSLAVAVDVADAAAVESAAARVETELGPIDVWVNNAMTTVFAPVGEVTPDEYRRATEVTYLGQVYGTLAALRRMRRRDRGVICNVGSALAFRAICLQAAYCGAKFAARGFTESLRSELLAESSGVRVTMVHLPAVNTPQFGWCRNKLSKRPQPVPPTYAPDVAAERIVKASLRPRRQRVLGGFNRFLIVANKVAPGITDHYVARTTIASQQTDIDVEPHHHDDLCEPLDDVEDHGARGTFAEDEGGMLNPTWLKGISTIAADAVAAAAGRAREVLGSL